MLFAPATRGFIGKGTPIPSFAFVDPPPLPAGTTQIIVSSPVSNLQAAASASASGGLTPQVAAGASGPWGSLATINPGGTVYARANASASWNTSSTTTVTVG